jgi:hypothetical protein
MGTINSNIDFTLASKKTTINTGIVLNPFAHLRDFFDECMQIVKMNIHKISLKDYRLTPLNWFGWFCYQEKV